MITLNLLPDIKKDYLKSQRTKRLFILSAFTVSAAVVGVAVLLGLFVFGAQNLHKSRVQSDIDNALSTLQSQEDLEKIVTIQKQLESLPELHDKKPVANRLFGYLATVVPANIALTEIEVAFDDDNEMTISGKGEDPKAVNVFVDTLKNATFTYNENETTNPFTEVILESVSIDEEDGTNYEITLLFDYILFDNTISGGELTVPKITTTTSVQQRPALFQEDESGDE